MQAVPVPVEVETWEAEGHSVLIEYSRSVLDEIRRAAVEGFTRLAHGGVEIGGVLFGRRDGQTVRIVAQQALECEYAFGPSFTLSENDKRTLVKLLAKPPAGLQPVGWYHSRTRSAIRLAKKDVELFDTFFPAPWQIALVVRPYRFDVVQAGFFFREPDGSIHTQSTYREFTVKPAVRRTTAPRSPVALASASIEPPYEVPVKATAVAPEKPLPAARERRPRRGVAIAAIACAALLVVAVSFLLATRAASFSSYTPRQELSLRAFDTSGQLRIDWDRNAPVLHHAQSGLLEIQDGGSSVREALGPGQLRNGSLTYVRRSGDVLVRLLLILPDRRVLDEQTHFLGPAPPPLRLAATGSADRAEADAAPVPKSSSRKRAASSRRRNAEPRRQPGLPPAPALRPGGGSPPALPAASLPQP